MLVKYSENLTNSPCVRLAVFALASLHSRDHAGDRDISLSYDDRVLWIENETGLQKPQALIVFSVQKWKGTAWISLGYVSPFYRRRGYYRKLYEELRARGPSLGFDRIESSISVLNTSMLEVSEKLGTRKTVATIWRDQL